MAARRDHQGACKTCLIVWSWRGLIGFRLASCPRCGLALVRAFPGTKGERINAIPAFRDMEVFSE